jgi:hypothetical protein
MKTLIAALAILVSTGSAAIAQSYDSDFGSGNAKPYPYRLLTYGYAPEAYYPYYQNAERYYGVPWRPAVRVSRYYPGYEGRFYRLGY